MPWQRIMDAGTQTDGSGAAGAFHNALQHDPATANWIARQVHAKHIAVEQTSTTGGLRRRFRGLEHLHADFLRQGKLAGLTRTTPSTRSASEFSPYPR
jgi:hypothetical protein